MSEDLYLAGSIRAVLEGIARCSTGVVSSNDRAAWKIIEKACYNRHYYPSAPIQLRQALRWAVKNGLLIDSLGVANSKYNFAPRAALKLRPDLMFELTATGRLLATQGMQAFIAMRDGPAFRIPAVRNILLRYICEESNLNRSWKLGFRFSMGPFGSDLTENEVEQTLNYLQKKGLIESVYIARVRAWMPWAQQEFLTTTSGMDCVTKYDGDVELYIRNQEREHKAMTSFDRTTHNYYYNAPVFQGSAARGAQIAWNSQTVNQTQNTAKQITAGYEDVARAVAETFANLPQFQLPAEDFEDAATTGDEILAEVVSEQPDRGKVRRGLATLRGFLSPVAVQAVAGAGEGAHELAKTAIEHLGSVQFQV